MIRECQTGFIVYVARPDVIGRPGVTPGFAETRGPVMTLHIRPDYQDVIFDA